MDLFFALIVCFVLLLLSVFRGVFIAYPLLGTLGIISLVLLHRGFSVRTLLKLGIQSSQKAFPVFAILLLIGAVTSTWMAAGTVPAIVYYGIQLIHPNWFILASFLLTGFVSSLIGTSFGAAGTIGLALMIMAKGSDVNSHVLAGAVIAGAYLGDRCSPMSSSAHLIATLTHTDLYRNLKNMVKTGIWPFIIACLVYWGFSLRYPLKTTNSVLPLELIHFFDLNLIVLLPAFLLLVLALLRVEAKRSMLLSIGAAIIIALYYQHYGLGQVLQFALLGFQLAEETPIQAILLGGGMLAMLKVCGIVVISTAIAGILAGTDSFQIIERFLRQIKSRPSLFLCTTLVSLAAAAFGCSQTIAILLSEQLMRGRYANAAPEQFALDLENTAVVLAPLIPWNIAGLVPATVLMTNWQFIPYAFYLYLIPAVLWLQLWWQHRHTDLRIS